MKSESHYKDRKLDGIKTEWYEDGEVKSVNLYDNGKLLEMEKREHFMPASLLESQLEALEVPDEAIHIDATLITKKQINQIQPYLI